MNFTSGVKTGSAALPSSTPTTIARRSNLSVNLGTGKPNTSLFTGGGTSSGGGSQTTGGGGSGVSPEFRETVFDPNAGKSMFDAIPGGKLTVAALALGGVLLVMRMKKKAA